MRKNKKPTTKKKALRVCVKLWDWMAKTGSYNKSEWPGWAKYGKMQNNCPCCQIAYTHKNCRGCPMKKLWPGGDCSCENPSSPYQKWKVAGYCKSVQMMKTYAKIIADAARKELKKEK